MNPSSFNQQMEQFVPVALQTVRVAFKVIPPLRKSVHANLIARLLEKLAGKVDSKTIWQCSLQTLSKYATEANGLGSLSNVALQNRVFAEAMANTTMEALYHK